MVEHEENGALSQGEEESKAENLTPDL